MTSPTFQEVHPARRVTEREQPRGVGRAAVRRMREVVALEHVARVRPRGPFEHGDHAHPVQAAAGAGVVDEGEHGLLGRGEADGWRRRERAAPAAQPAAATSTTQHRTIVFMATPLQSSRAATVTSSLGGRRIIPGGTAAAASHPVRDTSLASASSGIDLDPGDVAPQCFEPVEVARARREDVHDDVEVVEEDPFRFALPFGARRAHARGAQPLAHGVGDGLGLTGAAAAQDDEVVGVADRLGHVEHDGIVGLLGGGEPHGLANQAQRSLVLLACGYCRSFTLRSLPTMTTTVVSGSPLPVRTTPRPSIPRTWLATAKALAPARIWVAW